MNQNTVMARWAITKAELETGFLMLNASVAEASAIIKDKTGQTLAFKTLDIQRENSVVSISGSYRAIENINDVWSIRQESVIGRTNEHLYVPLKMAEIAARDLAEVTTGDIIAAWEKSED